MRTRFFLAGCLASLTLSLSVCVAAGEPETSAQGGASAVAATDAASVSGPKPVVLARVGDEQITVPEMLSYAASNPGLLPTLTREETKGQVLGAIIVSRLIFQALKQEGLLDDDYTDVELQLAVAELKRRHFKVGEMPSEQELRAFYDDHPELYSTPPSVRLSQILFAAPRNAEQGVRAEAYRRAEQALKRLNDGEAFDALARELTEEEKRRPAAGDVGFYPLDERQWYFEAVNELPVGGFTGILDTDTGYQILRVTDRREGVSTPFEQVASRIESAWFVEEELRLRDEYIRRLAGDIPITIEMEGYENAHPLVPGFTFVGGGL